MKISSKVSWLGKRLYRPLCGVLRWSVYNHTIWPMILSSHCYSLKLFSYSLDHQGKLAFIWSFSLISVSRPFLSLSALGDLLFSSPGPFDLRLSALVFTTEKEPHKEGREDLHFYCAAFFFFFTDICVIICVIIPSFNLLSVLLLSYQHFEFSREKLQAHWNVMLFMLPALLSLLTRPGQHIKTRAVPLHCLV